MPKFSMSSKSKLETCHPELQLLFNQVIELMDCTILEGHRGEDAQNLAFNEGRSKLKWPNGKHNSKPSMAVDAAPSPLPAWKKHSDFYYFSGFVKGVADLLYHQGEMLYKIRVGADWNQNDRVSDERFFDLVHFELVVS